MSDDFMARFALGYLAAGPSTQLASQGANIITRALCPPPPAVDVGALIAEIARLQNEVAYLEQVRTVLESNVAILRKWGNELHAELVSIKGL